MRALPLARVLSALIVGLLLSASAAEAQTGLSGSIAGVARDATGGVLPGVTVEASSPALIEKVRTVVTDGQGQYRIVDLRPGTYTVTFTLPGFSVVSRSDIELTTGFTATVNADLRVGSLEETLTVSGEAPVVDVQNVRTQNVLSRELLDAAPISRTLGSFAAVTVGIEGGRPIGGGPRDSVGGSRGESLAGFEARGDRQGLPFVEGLRIGASIHDGSTTRFAVNQLMAQEVVVETSGGGAESEGGGINVNIVLKDGSNLFSGTVNGDYSGRNLQNSNLSDELRERGVLNSNVVAKLYDIGAGMGGPLLQDKLWFYTAHRKWGGLTEIAGKYYNATQNTLFYTPDLNRLATSDVRFRDNTVRLTWQATPKHNIRATASIQRHCVCNYQLTAVNAPEASFQWHFKPTSFYQASWTHPATSRLLFEAGGSLKLDRMLNVAQPEAALAPVPVLELSTNVNYGRTFTTGSWYSHVGDHGSSPTTSYRAAASYITGSHAFKTGMTLAQGIARIAGSPDDVRYVFRNQLPVSLDQIASPNYGDSRLKYSLGLYGQDQWTIRRLTLNLGLRLDLLNEYNPAQTRPGGRFVPEIHFEPRYNVPNWKDLSPRLGLAYDLFGNGRTALKIGVNRYPAIEGTRISAQNNASSALAYFTRRTWNDANQDFVPNCDLNNKGANGECGAMANQNFGTAVVNQTYDRDVLEGWGARAYNWLISPSIDHQIGSAVGVRVTYFRSWNGNFRVVRNMAVSAADFDPFCVAAPVDARLPGGGGYQVCGAYDVKPAKFGQSSLLVKQAEGEGVDISRGYNGFEAVVNARFGAGGYLLAGMSTGQSVADTCALSNRPDLVIDDFTLRGDHPLPTTNGLGCKVSIPWSSMTQLKINGSYPLGWGIQAAAVLQNLPGVHTGADAVFTNAQIAPSLGRNLSACGTAVVCTATATVQIVAPGTLYEPRQTQVDLRFSKEVRLGVGQARVRPRIDLYNVFNANSVQGVIARYGPTWLRVNDVMNGRIVKFGAQLDF